MKATTARTRDGDPMIPANVSYPSAIIGTAIRLTATGITSNAPVAGTSTIGFVPVTVENAADSSLEDRPF
ncbi:MAG: hypothetical protein WBA25_12045 [Jannaschia sp.]